MDPEELEARLVHLSFCAACSAASGQTFKLVARGPLIGITVLRDEGVKWNGTATSKTWEHRDVLLWKLFPKGIGLPSTLWPKPWTGRVVRVCDNSLQLSRYDQSLVEMFQSHRSTGSAGTARATKARLQFLGP